MQSRLEEHGVELAPCGTCLAHYGFEPALGRTASMDDILDAVNQAEKVITL